MSPRSGKSLATARQSLYLAFLVGFLAGPARSAVAVDTPPSPSDCAAATERACLGDGRFLLEVDWFGEALAGFAEARPLGRDAVYFRSPGGGGLVVAVVDGRAVNGHFWVLSAAIAHPSYSLEVTDLATATRRSYSELDGAAGAASDLLALPAAGREAARPVSREWATGCRADDLGVCLHSGQLTVAARTPGDADLGVGEVLSEETAIFRRAGGGDPDLLVSVLDGREVNGHWWLLSSSPTGQEWDIAVADLGNGERRRLRHAAAAGDAQLVTTALAATTSVAVTLDAPRAVKQTIAVTGGALSAQSANGTKFTLTIPAGALLSPQEITLTPIKSIQRLPFKPGLVGGVEIGPAGLRLAATASLLIAPSQPVALAQETTFGYRASGAQFFLYPALLAGKPVVLPVIHTGGYGLARGTAAEQAKQLTRLPPRAEDQLSQQLWNPHAQRRHLLNSLAGEGSGEELVAGKAVDSLLAIYQNYYRDKLRKLLPAILGSCAGRKKSGPQAENFLAMASGAGFAASLATEFSEVRIALNLGTAACYNEAGRACLVEKESTAAVPMLVYWRQLVAAGKTDLVDAGKLQSCLTFELQLESVLDYEDFAGTWKSKSHHNIDTRKKVLWRPPFAFGSGAAGSTPHDYKATWTSLADPSPDCTASGTGAVDKSFLTVVAMLFLGVNSFEETPPPPKIELVYSPGWPQVEVHVECDEVGEVLRTFLPHFPAAFGFLQSNERDPDDALFAPAWAFRVADWQVNQGALYALRAYARGGSGAIFKTSEATNLYLYHKPGS